MVDPKGFDGVIKTVQNIGEVVARKDESRRIIRDTMMRKEKIVRFTQSLSKQKIFFKVCNAPMITVGRETLTNDLIRMAGGRSISEDESSSYPLYSIEAVILKSPEVIIISSMEKHKNSINLVKEWQNWKSIPAVKSGSIYVIDSNLVDRPAPRIAEGLEVLARMIHPGAFR
jgi:iron complex transport system substrate-binding protein